MRRAEGRLRMSESLCSSRRTVGHIVQTRKKLATARSAVKTAKEARLGITQTRDERKARVSVSVVTAIALTALPKRQLQRYLRCGAVAATANTLAAFAAEGKRLRGGDGATG